MSFLQIISAAFYLKMKRHFNIANELSNFGVGLMSLIDQCTLPTLDVDKWAGNLLPIRFSHDQALGTL